MKKRLPISRSLIKLAAFVVILMTSINSYAQKAKLQTAFIYQITQLIEWCPDGKEGNFTIGVLGNEGELMSELNALNNRRVGTQQVEVINIADLSGLSKTNILFVPQSQFNNIDQVTSRVSGFCTLIISDRPDSVTRGAGISIVYDERHGRLVLEINTRYMRANSLNVNRRLIDLASNVHY